MSLTALPGPFQLKFVAVLVRTCMSLKLQTVSAVNKSRGLF
jgi:hypothetical protein